MRDGDQRLAQVLSLHPAEDRELQHDAEQRDDHEASTISAKIQLPVQLAIS